MVTLIASSGEENWHVAYKSRVAPTGGCTSLFLQAGAQTVKGHTNPRASIRTLYAQHFVIAGEPSLGR